MSASRGSPRNLVACSDGTGMRASTGDGTNVWRLYQALDREHADVEQIAIHDDGVGSSRNKLLAALGGGMGFGLARNVRHLYAWLCTHYRPGDRIYLFGFSRGAFTVRCLGGMITRIGLLNADALSEEELHRAVVKVWFAFKDSQYVPAGATKGLAHGIPAKAFRADVDIEFIGVWDTVDAYGLPVDELKEAFAWASRTVFRVPPLHYLAMTRFNDRTLSEKVKNAYHAVAIDDERQTFHPVLWDATDTESRWIPPAPQSEATQSGGVGTPDAEDDAASTLPNLQQVWFSGMHTDVGGGYPRGSLSLVALDWMMTKAEDHGLVFSAPSRAEMKAKMSPQGPMHDSRAGTGAYYRYAPRPVETLCKDHHMGEPILHDSVMERVDVMLGEGAPAVLPTKFRVVATTGEPTPGSARPMPVDSIVDPTPDPDCLNRIRMLHWRRWFLYFFFLLWTATLVALLAAGPAMIAGQPAPPWKFLGLGYLMSLVQRFTPGMLSDAVGTLRGLPFWTLSMAAVLGVLSWRRQSLVGQIHELRKAAWNAEFREKLYARNHWSPSDRMFRVLEGVGRRRTGKEHEKMLVARLVVVAAVGLFGYWMYNWFMTGVLLPGNLVANPVTIEHGPMGASAVFEFEPKNPSLAIGPVLERGERYRISVTAEGWTDAGAPMTPAGDPNGPSKPQRFFMGYRDWRADHFTLLASVGSENGQTYAIGDGYETQVLANDTRFYVFVNERVCYWCPKGGAWAHYADNGGHATIRVERLPREDEQSGSSTPGR